MLLKLEIKLNDDNAILENNDNLRAIFQKLYDKFRETTPMLKVGDFEYLRNTRGVIIGQIKVVRE